MKIVTTKKDPLDLAIDWIVNSGIQSEAGGFYAWYNLSDKSYSYLYSEITGYGMTTLLYLYGILREEHLLEKARKAAEWIISSSLQPCGGVKTRLYKDDAEADRSYSFSGENIFSFDTGMALYGMVNLYAVTGEERFLEISKAMARFLIDKMQNKDGSLSPIYHVGTDKVVTPGDNKWSNQSGPFHAKVSLGLVELFRVTGDEIYKDAAIRLCKYALTTQEDSGRFITDSISRTTNLHPHCYAAEGLWYTGASLKIPEFTESARKAGQWAFKNLSASGINELYYPSTNTFNDLQRSDIMSQILRLGLIFSFNDKIDMLKSLLLSHQYLGQGSDQKGGFLFSRGGRDINSWCSMFAVSAMTIYHYRDSLSKDIRTKLFV